MKFKYFLRPKGKKFELYSATGRGKDYWELPVALFDCPVLAIHACAHFNKEKL